MVPEQMAAMIATLMARLGYTRYAVQGGDYGAIVGSLLARNDAGHVIGLHLNFCSSTSRSASDPYAGLQGWEVARMRERDAYFDNETTGWIAIQQRKPQNLGFGLNDSPVGLAAWLVHNFRVLCDCDGDVEKKFTKDELLTNVMIYWVTQSITSAMRLYHEGRLFARSSIAGGAPATDAGITAARTRLEVPTGCAVFPKEARYYPRSWVEATYNLTRWTEMPRGGHFAPMEEPQLLVDDIRAFFRGLK